MLEEMITMIMQEKTQHNPCLLMWDEIIGSGNYVSLITHEKCEIRFVLDVKKRKSQSCISKLPGRLREVTALLVNAYVEAFSFTWSLFYARF